MKNYYFIRNKDNIYRFYIFPQAFRARVRRRPTKKKKTWKSPTSYCSSGWKTQNKVYNRRQSSYNAVGEDSCFWGAPVQRRDQRCWRDENGPHRQYGNRYNHRQNRRHYRAKQHAAREFFTGGNNIVIPWNQIVKIGGEVIIVNYSNFLK